LPDSNKGKTVECKRCRKKIAVERTTRGCPHCYKGFSTGMLREIKEHFNGGHIDRERSFKQQRSVA